MARTRTLAELLAEVADRADMSAFSTTTFVTKAQATRYLNQSAYRFWGRLVKCYGDDYFQKAGTIAAVSGTAAYDLPADCFQPNHFAVTIGGTRGKIPTAQVEDIDVDTVSVDWVQRWPRHRVANGQVIFYPTPRASYTVAIDYIPQLLFTDTTGATPQAELSADTDKMNGHFGWEEWIFLDAVRKCVEKEQRDTSSLVMELRDLWADIAALAPNRTTAEAPRIRQTYVPDGAIDDNDDD